MKYISILRTRLVLLADIIHVGAFKMEINKQFDRFGVYMEDLVWSMPTFSSSN
jgi:hypothetical protein